MILRGKESFWEKVSFPRTPILSKPLKKVGGLNIEPLCV